MPLFGQKHAAGQGAAGYGNQAPLGANTANNARTDPMLAGGGNPAMGSTMPGSGPGAGGQGRHHTLAGAGDHQQGMNTNFPGGHNNNQGNVDPYANTVNNNEVTPVNHFSSGQQSGTGSSVTGKVERAIGTLVCSQSLKAKGIEKEREAQAKKSQSVELAEAERLEQEALVRRGRAVDFGAHPANNALGGSAQAQEYGGNFGQAGAAGTGTSGANSAAPMNRGGLM
ncbi:hypothetical protein EW026_g4946 [Hermanssonia centrifuga]|uniref:Uncharacterized protein n=1 Tax=Hermanssonia centrifuga TaxID=98765 RepID=A0A4S4KG54_9APHY|nr:hypothetical protein EW026_g4946 [Hermanssonia centrifuga]